MLIALLVLHGPALHHIPENSCSLKNFRECHPFFPSGFSRVSKGICMRVIDAGNKDRHCSRHGPFSVKAGHSVLPEIPSKASIGLFNTVSYLLRGILCVLSASGIFLSIALVPHKPAGFQHYSAGTFQCSKRTSSLWSSSVIFILLYTVFLL